MIDAKRVNAINALSQAIVELINASSLDDGDTGVALAHVVGGMATSSELWDPITLSCAMLDMMSMYTEKPLLSLLGEISDRALQHLAKRGDPAAREIYANIGTPPRASKPRRTIRVGRRHHRR